MSKIIKVKILDDENHNDFCRLYDDDIPNISKKLYIISFQFRQGVP